MTSQQAFKESFSRYSITARLNKYINNFTKIESKIKSDCITNDIGWKPVTSVYINTTLSISGVNLSVPLAIQFVEEFSKISSGKIIRRKLHELN